MTGMMIIARNAMAIRVFSLMLLFIFIKPSLFCSHNNINGQENTCPDFYCYYSIEFFDFHLN